MKYFNINNFLLLLLASAALWLSTANSLKAQDPHFSQNYATPLYINPAMTGIMNGDVRVAAVYRNQWSSVMPGAAFRTVTGSVDMTFKGAKEHDRLAVGLLLYNDKGGDLGFGTNYIDAAVAYNVGLSETTFFSLGVEAGFVQKGFDLSSAQFGNQYDGVGFEPSISASENFETTTIWRSNLAAGAMFYMAPNSRTNVYAGGGMYHFLNPNVAFTPSNEPDKYMSKISTQVGGSVPVSEIIDIVPSAYFIKQGIHNKLEAGTFVRFILDSDRRTQLDKAFNLGAWMRLGSHIDNGMGLTALVLATKIDFNTLSVGLSYDLSMGTTAALDNNRGGYEIAVVYTARVRQQSSALSCPRF